MNKLIPIVTVHSGFHHLKMEEISKIMGVSRATMYKYFSSKEELASGIVEILVNYIEELEEPSMTDGDTSYGRAFQQIFEQSLSSVGKMSEVFLTELETVYPELFDKLNQSFAKRNQKVAEFYAIGKEKKIFNPVNEKFLVLQDTLLLREITNMKYLVQNQTSMEQVLLDYYQLKKFQLFRSDKLSIVDDSIIIPIIRKIAEKNIRNMTYSNNPINAHY
ncbi:TetR/AcrR family transcriptional regulator [Paenibacillus gorillae]|uniref:TetR/AcrR family transcriptional regulator n=1 Tax=Paenibacillus gorillae TaxID=1243662 RepID=UPI001EE2FC7B|nr:TetR/AcrR family transcriptional regulator [Paenibacillus gorillae]